MREGQVGKRAFDPGQQPVEFPSDHVSRRGEGQGIARERPFRAAEHIARKLVERHDKGERCEGGRLPRSEIAARRPLPNGEKAAADLRVERFRLLEPRFARPTALPRIRRAEPEIEHLDEIRCTHERARGRRFRVAASEDSVAEPQVGEGDQHRRIDIGAQGEQDDDGECAQTERRQEFFPRSHIAILCARCLF